MPRQDVSFIRHFADLPDPRLDRTKRHPLIDVLAITLCATVAGADSFEQVAKFGVKRVEWLKTFLALPNGIPSHDTFNRVLSLIDPARFAACVASWMAAVCQATGLRHVAIDGKSCRCAPQDTATGTLHLVSAWAVDNGVILGQQAVEGGSNEIAAIPELLRVLDLKGTLVTIDAAGCQKEIAARIVEQGGDYLLAVKGNQPTLHAAAVAAFDALLEAEYEGIRHSTHGSEQEGHGREEGRYVTVIPDPEGIPEGWPGVRAVVLVCRERKEGEGARSCTMHYYITSLKAGARELGRLIRGHWGIENGLHWVLDTAFGEDDDKTREGHAGANLGLIRRVALSLLKQDPGKGSINTKRYDAALDQTYLSNVLRGFPQN
jgi:predicted transposase YbfD/YdcC